MLNGDSLLIFYPQVKWGAYLPNTASSTISLMFSFVSQTPLNFLIKNLHFGNKLSHCSLDGYKVEASNFIFSTSLSLYKWNAGRGSVCIYPVAQLYGVKQLRNLKVVDEQEHNS